MLLRSACPLLALGALIAASPGAAAEVPFAPQPALSTGLSAPVDARLADLDGDGDLDIVFASRDANELGWLEQTGSGFTQRTIEALTAPTSAFVADLDADGDLDVVATSDSQDRVRWYENDGASPPAFTGSDVSTTADGAEEVVAADVNGDGDLDLVSASKNDDEIAWFESDGASPPGFTRRVIDEDPDAVGSGAEGYLDGSVGVLVFDPDRDGDPDVAAIGVSTLAWFENTNGIGTAWSPHTVASGLATGAQLAAGDLDRDGDADLVAAIRNDDSVFWYENDGSPGTGSWTQRTVSAAVDFGTGGNVSVGDVDGDGDVDVLTGSAVDQKLFWFESDGAAVPGFTLRELAGQNPISHPAAGDVDGDGDADLVALAATGGQIRWIRNDTIHRSAAFPVSSTIDAAPDLAYWVSAGDLDRDGDLDALILNAGATGGIRWRENTDGQGTFGSAQLIASPFLVRAVRLADVDRDGDPDLVTSATIGPPVVAWHENTSGDGSAWTTNTIATNASFPSAFRSDVGDIDGDGDLDVFAASTPATGTQSIAWFENTAGGSAWAQHAVANTVGAASDVRLADVDGDGDLDAFYTDASYAGIFWKENTAGDGSAWTDHAVEDGLTTAGPATVEPVDLDRDGDVDVVVASEHSNNSAWFENETGGGTSWTRHLLGSPARLSWVRASDLDLDGDVDVVGVSEPTDDVYTFENTAGDGSAWTVRALGANVESPDAVDVADVDGDGDPDLLATGFQFESGQPELDGPVVWLENRGGQFALPTDPTPTFPPFPVAYEGMIEGDSRTLLSIQLHHRGRVGDSDVELAAFELRLVDPSGTPLTDAEADALFSEIRVFFVSDETICASATPPFSLTGGVLTLPCVDGDPNAQVDTSAPKPSGVTVTLNPSASTAPQTQFHIVHLTESSSAAEDASTDLPLSLEFEPETDSGLITALPYDGDYDGDGLENGDEFHLLNTDPANADTDGDALDDGLEETVYGSNPKDADSDNDGLEDGWEVNYTATEPLDPDTDTDGYCDGGLSSGGCTAGDNCPAIDNPGQENSDAWTTGDVCQCGNLDGVGGITATDYQRARELVVGRTPSGPVDPDFCDVGGSPACDVFDLMVLQQILGTGSGAVGSTCNGFKGL